MAAFTESQELQDLGKHLIEQNFPTLGILKIGFLFRDKSRKIQGRLVPGDARKSSDRDWSLHSKDFVIEVAEDVWQEATNEFRLAIMDHLLARVGIDFNEDGTVRMDETTGRIKTYNRKPDITEFTEVIQRHGAYYPELREFLDTFLARQESKDKEPFLTPPVLPTDQDELESIV